MQSSVTFFKQKIKSFFEKRNHFSSQAYPTVYTLIKQNFKTISPHLSFYSENMIFTNSVLNWNTPNRRIKQTGTMEQYRDESPLSGILSWCSWPLTFPQYSTDHMNLCLWCLFFQRVYEQLFLSVFHDRTFTTFPWTAK